MAASLPPTVGSKGYLSLANGLALLARGALFSAVPSRLAPALVVPSLWQHHPLPLARGRNPATPARFLWRFSCRCKKGSGSAQAAPAVAACDHRIVCTILAEYCVYLYSIFGISIKA
jgi:hypothetical protein